MATRDNDIKYKYEAYWSDQSGWHFSFGNMRMWQSYGCHVVAELVEVDKVEQFQNHEEFDNMQDALDYMRTKER